MSLLFLTGVLSILAQVVTLRELTVASFGVELVSIVALGAWLLGSAAGAAADALSSRGWLASPEPSTIESEGGSSRPAHAPGETAAYALLAALGLGVLPVVAIIRTGRVLLGGVPGAYLPLASQLALVASATLPLSLLTGLAFQWSARLLMARGRTLAAAYAIESAGAVIAGAASTAALRAGVSTFAVAGACAWTGIVIAASLVQRGRGLEDRACLRRTQGASTWRAGPGFAVRQRLVPAVAGVVAAFAWYGAGSDLDARLTRVNHPALVLSRDTPYARITIEGHRDQASLFQDDALVFTTGDVESEVLAHLVLLQHPAPRQVLALGGSVSGVPREALLHGAATVTAAEVDERMLHVVRPFFPEAAMPREADGRVRLVIGDPRQVLEELDQVEAILVATPEPISGAANRFYTREFFERCRRRLRPDGVLGLRLHISENTWTPVARTRVAAVHAALAGAFRHVQVLPTPTLLVMIGSPSSLPPVDVLLSRMAARGLSPRLATPEFVRYVYDNDRRAEAERLVAVERAPANTDASPSAFRDAMVQWVGRFWPSASSWDVTRPVTGDARLFGLGALLSCVAATWVVRRSSTGRRLGIILVAGFVGMVLEAVVLLYYQVTSGVLFADLGMLLTGFMSGLALGAFLWARTAAGRDAPHVTRSRGMGHDVLGRILLLVFAAIAAGVAAVIHAGLAFTLPVSIAVLVAAGTCVGALFGWASASDTGSRASRWLYAADLFGGCAGAVAGGLVLVPFGGLSLAAMVCASMAALAVALP